LILILSSTSCKRGPDNAAIRQGVVERLEKQGINVSAIEVNVQSLEVQGKEADVTVALTLKAGPATPPMVMRYKMQQQGDKWVVLAPQGGHGGESGPPPAASPQANPHGAGGAMPSPEDLPPTGKKK